MCSIHEAYPQALSFMREYIPLTKDIIYRGKYPYTISVCCTEEMIPFALRIFCHTTHNIVALQYMMNNRDIDINMKLDKDGRTMLMLAERIDIVKYLLSFNPNIEYEDDDGYTALTYASVRDHIDIAALLIKYGAYRYHRDDFNKIPIQYASSEDMMELLLYP